MTNVIKDIYKWQVDAGNASKPYDDFLESSFQIEEALEGLNDLPYLQTRLHSDGESHEELCTPKGCSRQIVRLATMDDKTPLSDVDRLDKACDAIVFAIGSMAKLGLDAHGITQALSIVNQANKQKLSCPRDSEGKLLKPEGFQGPEAKLQELLDKIKS
jgi:predicted HAD superfamily Cof-like phosphohydrolase